VVAEEDDVDLYEILGVAPTATTDEIRAAYRARARAAHPDSGGSSGLFRMLRNAHDTLVDPDRRRAYDRRRGGGSSTGESSSRASSSSGGQERFEPFPMPNLVGVALEPAVDFLRVQGVELKVDYAQVGWSEASQPTVVAHNPSTGSPVRPGDVVTLEVVGPEALRKVMGRAAGILWSEAKSAARRYASDRAAARAAAEAEAGRQAAEAERLKREKQRMDAAARQGRAEEAARQKKIDYEAWRHTRGELLQPVWCAACGVPHKTYVFEGELRHAKDDHVVRTVRCFGPGCTALTEVPTMLRDQVEACSGCGLQVFSTHKRFTPEARRQAEIVRKWTERVMGGDGRARWSAPASTRSVLGSTHVCSCGFRNLLEVTPLSEQECGGCDQPLGPAKAKPGPARKGAERELLRGLAAFVQCDLRSSGAQRLRVEVLITPGTIEVSFEPQGEAVRTTIEATAGAWEWVLLAAEASGWWISGDPRRSDVSDLAAEREDPTVLAAVERLDHILGRLLPIARVLVDDREGDQAALAVASWWSRDGGGRVPDLRLDPGWYPDPRASFDDRWWGGSSWGDLVRKGEAQKSDPKPPPIPAWLS
jgi:hypothetical protein